MKRLSLISALVVSVSINSLLQAEEQSWTLRAREQASAAAKNYGTKLTKSFDVCAEFVKIHGGSAAVLLANKYYTAAAESKAGQFVAEKTKTVVEQATALQAEYPKVVRYSKYAAATLAAIWFSSIVYKKYQKWCDDKIVEKVAKDLRN